MNPPDPSTAQPLLEGLNPAQRDAVTHSDGPALVLAGAGSGKTRVITHRIAWLLAAQDVAPWQVTAVTFTNKAAGEMRERVGRLTAGHGYGTYVGTFHALCLRILRRDGEHIGLRSGFNIYDSDDQRALVRRILKEETDDPGIKPRAMLSRISRAKNNLESPSRYAERAHSPEARLAAAVYTRYEDALRRANAVDFDDLLIRTLELFEANPAVLAPYAERCRHLLVDEYQDTNRPQYLLIRQLSSMHHNLFVVGDEDQSIYRFRGAEIRNILDFERDHPGARIIRLEQNYRSTGTILDVAGAVIRQNVQRKGKELWTENPRGALARRFRAQDDRTEAEWVAQRIREAETDVALDDVAILYRTNAQSRLFEEVFRRERIPYQVIGAVQFYDRREVKDLLAYLKLLANPADDVSFRRVVNTPSRGIGDTSMRAVETVATTLGVPLMEAGGHALEQGVLGTRPANNLRGFLDLMADLLQVSEDEPVEALLGAILERTSYEAFLEKSYPGQGEDRMENVRALVSAAAEYDEEGDDGTLLGFLDRSALVGDTDGIESERGVTMMTIHCAKGLEYRAVFLAGLEENLFPHARSTATDDDLEEERRLCYVAMTRAQEFLALTHADLRRVQGALLPNAPSRFLDEIPPELIEDVSPRRSSLFESGARTSGYDVRAGGSSAARAALKDRPRISTPAASGAATRDGYTVGRRVRHPKFGNGTILAREGADRGLKLTIDFRDHGRKKILPSYTKLQVET